MNTGNVRTKLNQQILEEAAQWFVDFRDDDIDHERHNAFTAWLRRSPEHVQAYLEVSAFWADVPQIASTRELDVESLVAYALTEDNVVPLRSTHPLDSDPASEQSLPLEEEQACDGGPSHDAPSQRPVPRSTGEGQDGGKQRSARRLALAACVLIACVTAGFAGWYAVSRGPTYTTSIGEQRSIVLADGSTIDLNARSRVQVRFTEHSRDVKLLEGQALFRVAKDRARPFIVHSDDARVRAVGTQFDVYRRKTGTTVTVLEGRVAVLSRRSAPSSGQPSTSLPPSPLVGEGRGAQGIGEEKAARTQPHHAAAIELAAGEQVRVTPVGAIEAPAKTNAASATAWTQRQIVFQGAPLTDVVEEFNRYNKRQMIIGDASIETVRISGVFSSTDPTSLLRFLRELPMFSVYETDNEIRITRRQEAGAKNSA